MCCLPVLHLAVVLSSILKSNAGNIFSMFRYSKFIVSLNLLGNGALRLIWDNQYSDTQAWNSGIVQIYLYYVVDWADWANWGNICDDCYFSKLK